LHKYDRKITNNDRIKKLKTKKINKLNFGNNVKGIKEVGYLPGLRTIPLFPACRPGLPSVTAESDGERGPHVWDYFRKRVEIGEEAGHPPLFFSHYFPTFN